MSSIALTQRVQRLEEQMAMLLVSGTVQGMKMQLGRTEKRVNEAVRQLQEMGPALEQVQLDVDKVRAEYGDGADCN